MSKPVGILPFDSNDSSIILRCTCKSLAEVTAANGLEVVTGANQFDAERGVKSLLTTGGIRFNTPTGYEALKIAGQISFEIESAGICEPNASILSSGADWASNEYILVVRDATATNYLRFMMDSVERFFVGWTTASVGGGASPSSSTIKATSLGKGPFSRFTFSWVGNQYSLYLNGLLIFSGARNGYPTADIGSWIELLGDGGLGGQALIGYYARNFMISTKPVVLSTHPALKRPAIIGHSFAARARYSPGDSYRDHSIGQAIGAELFARGLNWNMPFDNSAVFFSSGATINRDGGNPLKTQVDLAVAFKPDVAIYIGGTNDVLSSFWTVPATSSSRAKILADLKLDIIDLMAVAKRIVVCNVPSVIGNAGNYASANRDENVREINTDIATLPSWWDTAYPTRAGALVVADLWTALGGATPPKNNFWGTALENFSDLHPSAQGNLYVGKAIAAAIEELLSKNL